MTVVAVSTGVLARAAEVLAREAGMACPPDRERALQQALQECCRRHGIRDAESYLLSLEDRPSLLDDLVDELTVGETYFFRDTAQFDLVRGKILPTLIRDHGSSLRAWSAGCASGEEAYSIAIALIEAGASDAAPVIGTDISYEALRKAEAGIYGDWSFRGVPDAVRARYFDAEGRQTRIHRDIQARVRFEWLNLFADGYPSMRSGVWSLHLILCRNVLIYLTPEAIAHVARRLHDSLAPGGWLVAGASDPPLAEMAPFETVATGAGIVYRRASGQRTAPAETAPTRVEAAPAEPVVPGAIRQPAGPAPARRGSVRPAAPTIEQLRSRLHALADAGQHDELDRVLAHAVKAHPLEAELHYLSAVLWLEKGRDEAAADAARRALYLDPGLVVAAMALGSALRRLGDPRGARRAYRSAAAILAKYAPDAPVDLADGEKAGGLRRSVDSLLALAGSAE